jgi:hypothetical protein
MEGLRCTKWGEMSVTDTIFGGWEIAVADDIYITNRNGSYFVHRLTMRIRNIESTSDGA